jgi:hypothetical protein
MFCGGVCSESISSSEELVEEVDKAEDDDESEDSFTSSPIKPLLSGLFSTRSGIDPICSLPFSKSFLKSLRLPQLSCLPLAGCFDNKVIVLQSPRRDEPLSFNLFTPPIVKKEFVSDML